MDFVTHVPVTWSREWKHAMRDKIHNDIIGKEQLKKKGRYLTREYSGQGHSHM